VELFHALIFISCNRNLQLPERGTQGDIFQNVLEHFPQNTVHATILINYVLKIRKVISRGPLEKLAKLHVVCGGCKRTQEIQKITNNAHKLAMSSLHQVSHLTMTKTICESQDHQNCHDFHSEKNNDFTIVVANSDATYDI
jgi:hypothetical protein